jgi:anti-sigma B factor antagonist
MKISTRTAGRVTVVDLSGDLAPDPGDTELRDAVSELVDAGHSAIVLNFEHVRFVSSAGIGELIRCFQRVTEAKFEIKIAHLQSSVRHLLHLVKLDQVIESFEDEAEAVRSFPNE